jgi:hypothetical protein
MKQLALIDSLIPDVAIFKESLNEDTDFIIFDYYTDSLDDLSNKIETGMYEKIGIVQEDNGSGRVFHQFDNNTLVEFLKSRHQCQSLDFFMCNGYLSWKPEIDQLAETTGIQIGAATTLIGKGYWKLHNGVDVSERYMRDDHVYPHVFMPNLLTISNLSIADKVYDKTDTATISSYTLNGILTGQYVTLVARFVDVNVGTNKTLYLDLSGRNFANYYLQYTTVNSSADITAKNLTITGITANDKEYSNSTSCSISGSPTLNGIIDGDTVSAVFSSAQFTSSDIGTHTVRVSYTLSGASASNYKISSTLLSASITPKTLTLSNNTIVIEDKTYDRTADAIVSGSVDLSGTYENDICVLSGYNFFESINAGTQNVIIGITGPQSYRYKMPNDVFTATINKKNVVLSQGYKVSAISKYYDGTPDVTINNWELRGLIGPDVDTVSLQGTFANASVGNNKPITYVLNDPTGNYILTTPTDVMNGYTTASIYAIVIYYNPSTIIATSKEYNRSNLVDVTTPEFRDGNNSIITLDDCTFIGTLASMNVGTHLVTFSLSGSGASNYILSATNNTLVYASVSAVALTVTGNNIYAGNKTYNGNTSAIIYGMSLSSGVISEDNVGIMGSSSSFTNANVGTWTVNPVFSLYGTARSNYTLIQPTLSTITATISPATLTVGGNITVVEKQYDGNRDATITGAELKGVISGDNVSLSVIGEYEDESIGLNKPVSISYSVSGTSVGNYTFSSPTTYYYGNIISDIPAPTNVVAVAGVQSASISFTPPINGTVGYYIVTASTPSTTDEYTTGYSSPIMVDNLKNSASYQFTVRPYDANGNAGTESAASNYITTLSDSLNYSASAGRTYTVYGGSSSLVTVSIPSTYLTRSVAYIGDSAFANYTSLLNVSIPSSVISIGSNAFDGCSALTTISVNVSNPYLYVSDKTVYSIDNTILYKHFRYTDSSFSIPDTVTTLVGGAFYGCSNISLIILPENMSAIGSKTFYNCSSLEFVVFTSELSTFTNPSDSSVFSGTNVTTIYYLQTASLNTTWSGNMFGLPTAPVSSLLQFL